jgi:hypothetical protein
LHTLRHARRLIVVALASEFVRSPPYNSAHRRANLFHTSARRLLD